jgi:hypothetical protein
MSTEVVTAGGQCESHFLIDPAGVEEVKAQLQLEIIPKALAFVKSHRVAQNGDSAVYREMIMSLTEKNSLSTAAGASELTIDRLWENLKQNTAPIPQTVQLTINNAAKPSIST